MIEKKDRFTIKIKEDGLEIINEDRSIYFTAIEALMLLDILKNEEENLNLMAEKATPIPIKLKS